MKSEQCRVCRAEVTWWSIFANIGLSAYKGLLGAMTGSVALVADSLHSAADVVASVVTLFSLKVSDRKANEKYPYGYGNIQFIASSIVGVILILGAIYLMYESVMKIVMDTLEPPSAIAVLGAVVSIIVNELMYRYQGCVGKENNSPAIIANAWDNRSDALSSVGVLIGISFAVLGYPIADVLAALVVGVMVAKIGVELNVEAIEGLMDSSIEMDVLKTIYDIAMDTPKVDGVQFLRGRNVGEDVHVDICVLVKGKLKVNDGDVIAEAVKKRIFKAVAHVTDLQVAVSPVPA
jgi:cation diffusion facilitator family transporter